MNKNKAQIINISKASNTNFKSPLSSVLLNVLERNPSIKIKKIFIKKK